jgi:hypothetical protein
VAKRYEAGQNRPLWSRPAAYLRHLGQSEIQNLGVSALGNEDVCGLDVAMHYAFRVRGIQGIGNFDG